MNSSTQRLLLILLVVVVFAGGLLLGHVTRSTTPQATPTPTPVADSNIVKKQVSFASCGKGSKLVIPEYSLVGSNEAFYQIKKSDQNLQADDKKALDAAAAYVASGKASDLEAGLPQLLELIQPTCAGGVTTDKVLQTADKNGSSTFDQSAFLDTVTDSSFKARSVLVAEDADSYPTVSAFQIAVSNTEVLIDRKPLMTPDDTYYDTVLKACPMPPEDANNAQMTAFGTCAVQEFGKTDWVLPSDASLFGEFYKAAHA